MSKSNYRTSDGAYYTLTGLRRGLVDTQTWKDGEVTHVTVLRLIARPGQPDLFRINHVAYRREGQELPVMTAQHDVITETLDAARKEYRNIRANPPQDAYAPLTVRNEP